MIACNWQPDQGAEDFCDEPSAYYVCTSCDKGQEGSGPVCVTHLAMLRRGETPCLCGGMLSVIEARSLAEANA